MPKMSEGLPDLAGCLNSQTYKQRNVLHYPHRLQFEEYPTTIRPARLLIFQTLNSGVDLVQQHLSNSLSVKLIGNDRDHSVKYQLRLLDFQENSLL